MSENYRNVDWLSSVWRITTENPSIQKFKLDIATAHPAAFPEELAYRLIYLYSKPEDFVLDPFCGIGATNFIALSLNRKTIGYDIESKYIAIAQERCRKQARLFYKSFENLAQLASDSFQLCITRSPYLNVRTYSTNSNNIGNMVNPLPSLKQIFQEVYRVLKPKGYFCLNVANIAEHGYLKTFPFDMINLCTDVGLKFRSSIIWDKGIKIKEWNLRYNEVAENHEYVWVFKK